MSRALLLVGLVAAVASSGCGHRLRARVPINGRYRLPPSPGPEGEKKAPLLAARKDPDEPALSLVPGVEVEGPPVALAGVETAPIASAPAPVAQVPIMELHLADFEASDEESMAMEGDSMAQLDASIHFEWRRPKATRARVRLSAGDPSVFALHLDASTWVDRNASRVSIRIGVDVAGMPVSFRLPDVRVRPISVYGEKGVELTVPLVEGRF